MCCGIVGVSASSKRMPWNLMLILCSLQLFADCKDNVWRTFKCHSCFDGVLFKCSSWEVSVDKKGISVSSYHVFSSKVFMHGIYRVCVYVYVWNWSGYLALNGLFNSSPKLWSVVLFVCLFSALLGNNVSVSKYRLCECSWRHTFKVWGLGCWD